jgi:Na+-transporting NADH:ubiquinone oxidoreductase subunit NqrC
MKATFRVWGLSGAVRRVRACAAVIAIAMLASIGIHSASAQLVSDDADQKQLDRQQQLLTRAAAALEQAKQQSLGGDAEQARNAARTLMQIRSHLREPRVALVEGLLGRIAVDEGGAKQAMRFVEPWAQQTDTYDRNAFEAHLAAGDALVALDRGREAIVLLDWLTRSELAAPGSA